MHLHIISKLIQSIKLYLTKPIQVIIPDNNLTDIIKLFGKICLKCKKLIKQILAGQIDLVLAKIQQKFLNNIFQINNRNEEFISTNNVIILTTKHTHYVAHLIQKSLAEIGCYALTSEKFLKHQDVGQLYFVICPQMFSQLPRNFVAFQMEQSVSPRWFTRRYLSSLKKAYNIFDYSIVNIEFLLRNNISYRKIFYLPIGSFSKYKMYLEDIKYKFNASTESIEVLFYGDQNCSRRQMYLDKLKSEFNVYVASEIFGEELVSLICRSKVVVNIHYYETALLETTRIYETLSLGTPIVSESSIDINNHTDLYNIISFTPIGDVDAMIIELRSLLNDNLQQQRRLEISKFVEEDSKFFYYFKRFLLSNDLFSYGFDQYEKEVDFIGVPKSDIPRLCLSLTETPARKSAFLNKPTYGFEVVEGIRYYQGWIGCGMSYKYMLNKVRELESRYAIICEDDVIFQDDFEERIGSIITYLNQTNRQWHIFSGFISDLHADTNILAIEEYEGVEYIYIDKMTGMVMNIYSPKIIDTISLWDQTNRDSKTNTIDRYIESTNELIVVTTVPYLVGHSDDAESTLWGFNNTQYLEMIENSQKLLAEKVLHYKNKNRLPKDRLC